MRRLFPVFVVAALVSCSLLVHFDPESQPCDSAGGCGPGFTCIMGSDGGVCRSDAGTGGEGNDAGTCAARETVCNDGQDDDCDNQVDCLDTDCAGVACDDRNACTTGETCQSGACRGGTTKTCLRPPSTCHQDAGSCVPATGECTYPLQPDGTSCGTATSARCCNGTCKDLTTSTTDCGGCGLSCASGQVCQPVNQGTCFEPIDTSGRCSCGGTAACPGSQTCAPNGYCKPALTVDCAPRQVVVDAGSGCSPWCQY